jgi:hypothetical protein
MIIENLDTRNARRGYCFSERYEGRGVAALAQVKPLPVAAYVEALLGEVSKPTVNCLAIALLLTGGVWAFRDWKPSSGKRSCPHEFFGQNLRR